MRNNKPIDILTLDELSAYLRISKSTLYKLVREGRIPSQKIGRHWRFRKETIDKWMDRRILISNDNLSAIDKDKYHE